MGHHAHKLNEDWKLWTRDGTNGVYLESILGEIIEIPAKLLRQLVASDVLLYRISVLEQMEDNEILGLPEDGV